MRTILTILFLLLFSALNSNAADVIRRDVIPTSAGDLEIFFIGHSSLIMTYHGKVIHFDPYGKVGNYATLPRADLVFFTHNHVDHFDLEALQKIRKPDTIIIEPPICAEEVPDGWIMSNGESLRIWDLRIQAVPAYNIVLRREDGQPYHPRGIGNGYVITFANRRIYVAGDTENIPEIKTLKKIDCAFLPMSPDSTMTPAMVADVARAIKPKILYPYHYKETDPEQLLPLLKDQPEIEVRIRPLR
ncbi:MAG: MBL fold metallo-hydrolase [Desulfobulbus sp.]|nr:MBL fold metallo-hydrolase [Desulfobulbus sp.]